MGTVDLGEGAPGTGFQSRSGLAGIKSGGGGKFGPRHIRLAPAGQQQSQREMRFKGVWIGHDGLAVKAGRIVETVLESNTQLIANKTSWQDDWKRAKLQDLKLLLDGAIAALGKVGLMLNVHKDNLVAVINVLPALKRPTVSHLSDSEWMAVNTILDESTVRSIIPRLKQAGAEGIVEYPLNKIVM